MGMGMKVAVIPARGGSKRIPRKNIKQFCGKPMIHYPIAAALECGLFDRVIVTTDCEDISSLAQAAGAEVPFVRPPELCTDTAIVADVMDHAVRWLNDNGPTVEYVCCIVATAAFLQPDYLVKGLDLARTHDVDTVVSVLPFPSPAFRAFKQDDDGRLRFIWPEYEYVQSTDLPDTFHDAAQFYWMNATRFLASKSILGQEVLPIVLPPYLACDIDTPDDWTLAELMYETCRVKGLL